MTAASRLWADLASPAFAALPGTTIAVLPMGATEQHGPHLPVSVDSDLVQAVIDRALPQVESGVSVLVLPLLAVTRSGEHGNWPGTLSLGTATFLAVLADIGESVARSGVTRLVLFNGHGGNRPLMEVAARDLRIRHRMIVASASWFDFAVTDGLFDPAELAMDLHAGASETAAMLALAPDRVDMGRAPNAPPAMLGWSADAQRIGLTGQPARPAWIIEDLNASGVCGNAAAADPEAGRRLLDSAAAGFAAFLAEFARFDHRAADRSQP
jgi:creatinine amidohydrolase